MKEKSVENLIKGRDVFEPPRFMTVAQAASQLIEIMDGAMAETEKADDDQDEAVDDREPKHIRDLVKRGVVAKTTLAVGLARVGRADQTILVDTVENLSRCDLGTPLHSLIVAGQLHPLETDFLKIFYRRTMAVARVATSKILLLNKIVMMFFVF